VIVLDANVLIAHFESADAHHDRATALLLAHAAEPFVASVITLAEVYVGAARAGQATRLDDLIDRLGVAPLELPAGSARRLGELRALTRLRMPDCCVIYTAEHHGASIATFDEKLAAGARELGVGIVRATPEFVTQTVTGPDLAAGRIRVPAGTKPALPDRPATIRLNLRGRDLQVRWDPRNGPDRSRSGVLAIGRAALAEVVVSGERLVLLVRADGSIELS
jgi:predicted nucleic acid-binding protein